MQITYKQWDKSRSCLNKLLVIVGIVSWVTKQTGISAAINLTHFDVRKVSGPDHKLLRQRVSAEGAKPESYDR